MWEQAPRLFPQIHFPCHIVLTTVDLGQEESFIPFNASEPSMGSTAFLSSAIAQMQTSFKRLY